MVGVWAATVATASLAAEPDPCFETRAAVYDGKLYTLDLCELRPEAARDAIGSDPSLDYLFILDPTCSAASTWVAVLDGLQESGDAPLCREAEVTFKKGYPVRQFTSARDLRKAEARGEIAVTLTKRVHSYTVVRRLEKWPAIAPVVSLGP